MSLLPPALLQKLGRTRLAVRHATASTGIGERRSKAVGSGIEFADHRTYQFGDDIRQLDPHLLARLGRHYVRQYSVSQALPVTILLDTSRSMHCGQPSKFDFARSLAAGLAYAGLAGGDQVLVGAFSGGRVNWHHRLQGAARTANLMAWLGRLQSEGATDLHRAVRAALPRIGRAEGLTIIISDWFVDGIPEALTALRTTGQEIVAVHLLAPEEVEPERLGVGDVRFLDAETGHEIEATLDAGTHAMYRERLERWEAELRDQVRSRHGRYVRVRSDDDLEQVFLRDWRREGLIG
jgi:uncharacterized protein (DUF58 family)